jgi:hypothetical protein
VRDIVPYTENVRFFLDTLSGRFTAERRRAERRRGSLATRKKRRPKTRNSKRPASAKSLVSYRGF